MTQDELVQAIKVLRNEVEVLTSRLRPAGTGILHTAIDVINKRIDELIEEVTAPYWKDEDGDIGRLPGQTKASHLRSIEGAYGAEADDGFAEHTEAMEQARLKRIQDWNAGKKNKVKEAYMWSANKEGHWSPDENIEEKHVPDTVEHTEEYYDTSRNRQSMDTTSAESLGSPEPLPINTFK